MIKNSILIEKLNLTNNLKTTVNSKIKQPTSPKRITKKATNEEGLESNNTYKSLLSGLIIFFGGFGIIIAYNFHTGEGSISISKPTSVSIPSVTTPSTVAKTKNSISNSTISNSTINIVGRDQSTNPSPKDKQKSESLKISTSSKSEVKPIVEVVEMSSVAPKKLNIERVLKRGEKEIQSSIGFELSNGGSFGKPSDLTPIIRLKLPNDKENILTVKNDNYSSNFEIDGRQFILKIESVDSESFKFSLTED